MNMSADFKAEPIMRIEGLRHELRDKEKNERFNIYVDKRLEFFSKDFVGLLGPSGCGKTTLLTVLGLLRSPTHAADIKAFDLFIPPNGKSEKRHRIDLREAWINNNKKIIEQLRKRHFGFALQSGELISSLTVRENISIPLRLNAWDTKNITPRVDSLIDQFGLTRVRDAEKKLNQAPEEALSIVAELDTKSDRNSKRKSALANSRINRLSGGEYQRVALARAIAHKPSVVFVDEPTSALNRELARNALTAMRNMQHNRRMPGITFMITHDETLAEEFCNVIVRMAPRKNEPAGEVIEITRNAVISSSSVEHTV
jgi:ABC-type lipoprotein export system ATPase subunit